ncbi:hypothetical protein ACKA06_04560 [Rossellomorea oryzaecorticis]|uniref:Imidazoleglycerol-phosphate dehydratase n=1 Tax=Rossellomorea oryzaecorticis TaxID=1396505 RepID=A0ABW8VM18_9BACI
MTKKDNKGSSNQNSPKRGTTEFAAELTSGDNSKGNKHNKDQKNKSD